MANTNLSSAKAKAVAKPAPKPAAKSSGQSKATILAEIAGLKNISNDLGQLAKLLPGALGGTTTGATGKPGDPGYFTLGEVQAYMAANNGDFPPGLNTIVSGLSPSTLSNLASGYGKNTGSTTSSSGTSSVTQDAFALLKDTFTSYGLSELASVIEGYMKSNMGPYEAALLLKQTPEYKLRFAGNEARSKAGLDVLTEGEYISLEKQYSAAMKQYGVGEGSTNNLANRTQFAQLIGNDISPTELTYRLDTAVNQVQNADPEILKTLQTYYPGVNKTGLIAYFLDPKATLPVLQQQALTAEIGTAAKEAGLLYNIDRATALAKYGVTQQQAQTGYRTIGEVLPTASKLSDIYGAQTGTKYDQTTAEQQYLMNNPQAALQQKQLTAAEEATFSGKSGLSPNVEALRKSMQGAF